MSPRGAHPFFCTTSVANRVLVPLLSGARTGSAGDGVSGTSPPGRAFPVMRVGHTTRSVEDLTTHAPSATASSAPHRCEEEP